MLLTDLAALSRRVAETSSRNEKVEALASCLRRLDPDELEAGVAFLAGELRQGRIGVGPAAAEDAAGVAPAAEPTLTLGDADRVFEAVAGLRGPGSAAARGSALAGLFGRATREEQRFLARLLVGELRQGALEGLLTEALARAVGAEPRSVRRAAMHAGELRAVAVAALADGPAGLGRFSIGLFRPVQPMLAQPAEDLAEALGRLGTAELEWKLDGARVQVHKAGGDVRVFTRSLQDVTAAVPDLVEIVRAAPARELILDGEALALRPDGTPRPFQVTMRRFGRKKDVARLRESLPLTPFFFDCLHRDGETLVDRPSRERLAALAEALPPALVVPRLVTASPADADAFLADALHRGHEGVVAKALDEAYEAGRRGFAWLKVKPAHTLDLVVLAAEWGHGRRTGRLSNLHLGARDPDAGGFAMLGKTFKGLTDPMLAEQTRQLLSREIARDESTVYVRPELVVEVAFAGVQASPRYPSGLALRFARVKRYRPDKGPDQADPIEAVREIFERTAGRGPGGP